MSATTVASSLNLKDRAAARSARCVARDIASTSCLANVAICWPAKTVDATDCRPSNLLLSRKRPHQFRHPPDKAFSAWSLHGIEARKNAIKGYTAGEFGNDDGCLDRSLWTSRVMSYCNAIGQSRRFFQSFLHKANCNWAGELVQ